MADAHPARGTRAGRGSGGSRRLPGPRRRVAGGEPRCRGPPGRLPGNGSLEGRRGWGVVADWTQLHPRASLGCRDRAGGSWGGVHRGPRGPQSRDRFTEAKDPLLA